MEDKKITIKLTYPIKVKSDNGQELEIDEIKIGRLKTGHLRALPEGFTKKALGNDIDPVDLIPLVAKISGLSEESVDEIDVEDLFKIVEKLEVFLGTSRTRGKK